MAAVALVASVAREIFAIQALAGGADVAAADGSCGAGANAVAGAGGGRGTCSRTFAAQALVAWQLNNFHASQTTRRVVRLNLDETRMLFFVQSGIGNVVLKRGTQLASGARPSAWAGQLGQQACPAADRADWPGQPNGQRNCSTFILKKLLPQRETPNNLKHSDTGNRKNIRRGVFFTHTHTHTHRHALPSPPRWPGWPGAAWGF